MRKLKQAYLFLRWKFLGGDNLKKAFAKRSDLVARLFQESMEDALEPWIMNGVWSWNALDGVAHPLTLVFPERPLAILALGPEIGDWDKRRMFCYDRNSWEYANRVVSNTILVTKNLGVPLVTVGWDEPLSSETVKIKLLEALQGEA
jgi:hypothetical protein